MEPQKLLPQRAESYYPTVFFDTISQQKDSDELDKCCDSITAVVSAINSLYMLRDAIEIVLQKKSV